jgi:hypothetical protein
MRFLRGRDRARLGPSSGAPLIPTYSDVPLRLLLLFEKLPAFDAERLRRAVFDVDARLPDIRAEIVTEALEGSTHGHVGWGADEVIHVDGSSKAPESSILDSVLRHASVDDVALERARAAKGHIVLTSVGRAPEPEIRFLALTVVAAAFASMPGAVLVGNRAAHQAMTAATLRQAAATGLAGLRALPRLSLACGFDATHISGWRGTWNRTFGASRFGLPDLARYTAEPEPREDLMRLFTAVHDYLKSTGASVRPGDRLDVGDQRFVAREARRHESWLRSDDPLLVLEDRPAGP